MYNVSIPEITDEKLKERYQKIRPIVEYEGVKYLVQKRLYRNKIESKKIHT